MNIVGGPDTTVPPVHDSELVFLYTCTPLTNVGSLSSYGINCADMAGVPSHVIKRAFEVLQADKSPGTHQLAPLNNDSGAQIEQANRVLASLGEFDCEKVTKIAVLAVWSCNDSFRMPSVWLQGDLQDFLHLAGMHYSSDLRKITRCEAKTPNQPPASTNVS